MSKTFHNRERAAYLDGLADGEMLSTPCPSDRYAPSERAAYMQGFSEAHACTIRAAREYGEAVYYA